MVAINVATVINEVIYLFAAVLVKEVATFTKALLGFSRFSGAHLVFFGRNKAKGSWCVFVVPCNMSRGGKCDPVPGGG